jgi:FKBP-type peptidyl-prolyl cis-trans isomerase FklB
VRAMKNTTRPTADRVARRTRGLWILLAAAPLVGAQTPPPPANGNIVPSATAPAPAAPAAADPSNEQTSYLFGLTFGEQMHSVGISNQVDTDAINRGLKDGLAGKKSTRADQQQIQAFVQSVIAAQLAHNKAAAQEFLTRNGREKGVKTTADGLEYKVIIPGNLKAEAVGPNDEVTVNYRGKLLDGSEFDSSYNRGQPATFRVGGVIKGWQEAIVLMKPGAKWQLFVPPELAYDASPRPGIPAGSLLIFDVELLSVKPAAETLPGKGGGAIPPPVSHKVMPPLKPAPPSDTSSP